MMHASRSSYLRTFPATDLPLTYQVARADAGYVSMVTGEAVFRLQSAIGRIQANQPMLFDCVAQSATATQQRLRFVMLNGHVR
ncbi:hypothetical protein WL80_12635 [Burkholderia ubonensis]|nr:hypothetical protein WL51_03480 [Burkholderia ubonensis]KWE92353.1 hypothetical protein WL80_12635 [Burkholderia ubonensis]